MSTTTRSVRHHEVVGSFTGGAFTASRGTRDAVRPKPRSRRQLDEAALARAIKAGVAQGMAPHLAKLRTLTRDAVAVPANRTADSIDDFKARLDAATDAYRLRAAVNAANRERWGQA